MSDSTSHASRNPKRDSAQASRWYAWRLTGPVQGRGVRPAIARLARKVGIVGWVKNSRWGVDVAGFTTAALRASFEHLVRTELLTRLPGSCQWQSLASHLAFDQQPPPQPASEIFTIVHSDPSGPCEFPVPLDTVCCATCVSEIQERENRRFGFALNSCAHCGPRYSVLHALPYDRAETSLAYFPLCIDCQEEFADIDSVRYHVEGIGCPQCGPRIWFHPAAAKSGFSPTDCTRSEPSECLNAQPANNWPANNWPANNWPANNWPANDWPAIEQAAECIQHGGLLAVKGLGGYQIACDATNAVAVNKLRTLKQRADKPFAVMVLDVADAERTGRFSTLEHEALTSPAGPIVIVRARRTSDIASNVAPQLADIGLMLPTSGLHHMLLHCCGRPLVMTSANFHNEPLIYENEQARIRLSPHVDGFLHHNRNIVHPIDDSVVRQCGSRMVTIRAGRGIAPLPITLPLACENDQSFDRASSSPESPRPAGSFTLCDRARAIAYGAHQKTSIAISTTGGFVLGPHIGDLDPLAARERWETTRKSLTRLYHGAGPKIIAHDAHPDFPTTRLAQKHSQQHSGRSQSVQHHMAHALAAIGEAEWLDRDVLCMVADGTGWGTDRTIWGGELLRVSPTHWERVSSLAPFQLVGGDRVAREPWRSAVSVWHQAGVELPPPSRLAWNVSSEDVTIIRQLLARQQGMTTTSLGRLFDAVAAVLLGIARVDHEGYAALRLESACELNETGCYDLPGDPQSAHQIPWQHWLGTLTSEYHAGTPTGVIAMRFHRTLANSIAAGCQHFQPLPVVFSGGVFQNRVLVELLEATLERDGIEYAFAARIPPNDGGIAAGQLIATLRERSMR